MNHSLKSFGRAVALGGLLWGGLVVRPMQAQDANTSAKPDNTKVNKRDRNPSAPTADNQKENTSDRQLAAKIRRAIVKDKALSTYAHNVKVIVQGGNVTLKGPVHSEDEKKAVEGHATEVAGAGKVTNNISVTDASGKSKRHKKATPAT